MSLAIKDCGTPCISSEQLTLVSVMLERSPEGMTLRERTPTIFLPCGIDMSKGEMTLLTPCIIQQTGELALRSLEQESRTCPSPTAAFGRGGPVPHLGSTAKQALDMRVVGNLALSVSVEES